MSRTRAEGEWLELVADLLHGPSTALPGERIALQLCATFGLSAAAFNDLPTGGRHAMTLWPLDAGMGGMRAELTEWTMTRAVDEHPLLLFYRRTGHRVPLQIADVPEQVAGVRVRGGWADIGRPAGAAHQLSLPLRLDAGGNRSFVLGRPDVFGEQDLRLGTLLWRLLSGLDRQLDVLGRARPDPTAAVRLTPRQQAVLGLLAEGCTAAAIGHRLLIAERTVHKHLERVYAALGVSDRLTAVLRARDLGLLAPVRDLLEDAPTP